MLGTKTALDSAAGDQGRDRSRAEPFVPILTLTKMFLNEVSLLLQNHRVRLERT